MIETMAEANNASDHSLLWGYALEFWDRVGIVSLIVGAIIGVAALLLTAASAYILYRVADAAQVELVAQTKSSSELIAGLNRETARLAADGDASRQKIAEANARALEAQLALEKFKAPRDLNPAQQAQITYAVLPFKGTRFDMAVIPSDPEAIVLVGKIAGPLRAAGWEWIEFNHPGGPFMNVYTWPDLPNVGQFSDVGISIKLNSDHAAEFQKAADELSKALRAAGFDTTVDVADIPGIPNHDTLHILVGKKPQ
jgi:hypothetical protein